MVLVVTHVSVMIRATVRALAHATVMLTRMDCKYCSVLRFKHFILEQVYEDMSFFSSTCPLSAQGWLRGETCSNIASLV